MKKKWIRVAIQFGIKTKTWKIMRLSAFFLFLFLSQVWAGSGYSQMTKLTLKMDNVRVIDVLDEIENNSEFYFLFNQKLVDVERKVNVDAKELTIDNILTEMFDETDVHHQVMDRLIILTTEKAELSEATVLQQQNSVAGKVIDESGLPLPGVTVVIKGTTNGTVTNMDGNYSISNIPDNATLQFSFVGMLTQEIEVGGQTKIDVTLAVDAIGIEEVVAIGYGTKSRATVTGAVETVSAEQFSSKAQTNVTQSLQGAVPGLLVTRNSGTVGEGNSISIRGVASRSGTGVLVIIDGIPQPENNANALDKLNPQDIESISILKDAQASIYGSRAAGGVILVTTKSGKSNKPVITYSGNFAFNVPSIYPKRANIYDQTDYYVRAYDNDGISTHAYTYLEELLPTLDPDNPEVIPGPFSDVPKMWSGYYDWMDIMYDPAFQQTHQVSVSGKSPKSDYYVSFGTLDEPGMMAYGTNFNKRYFSRLKYKFDVNDNLSVSTNVSLEKQNLELPSRYQSAVDLAQSVWPTAFPYTQEGNYFNFGGFGNPIAAAEMGGDRENENIRTTANFAMNYKPIEGLDIKGEYSINVDDGSTGYINKIIQHHNYDDVPTSRSSINSAGSNFSRNKHSVINLYANYKYSYNDHNLGFMAGASHEENHYKFFSASRQKLVTEQVPVLTMGDPNLQNTNEIRTQWALQSYFGRINYNFKKRYLFEGTMRFDGSSKFAEGYKWADFWGGSGAWLASEEAFIKDMNVFDFLKFRLSYGEMGNQNNVGLYDHVNIINIGGLALFGTPDSPSKNLTASTSGVLPSPSRTWETVAVQNLGVDFRILNSRLNGNFDYFIRNTKDILVSREYPEVLGIAAPTVNGGQLRTNGWELSLNWSDKTKNDFNYFVNFTLADDKSKIISLEDAQVPAYGRNQFLEGEPYNSYYTLIFDGFIPDEATAEEYKQLLGVPNKLQAGDARYKDLDGDGKIEYSEYRENDPESGDLVNIGSSTIRFQYGFTIGGDWKGIDFSAFLQGIGKWNIMSNVRQPGPEWWSTPFQYSIGKDWTPENPNSFFPRASADGGIDSWNYQQSDSPYRWMNAKYGRLKNVQIGYTFSSKLVERVKLSKVRIYFSGNDLWEKTNIFKGLDPEKPYGYNLWQGSTPLPRTYSFGIDITL